MSYWIHVAGNIRFDSVDPSNKELKVIKEIIGKIPEGSEGALEVKILEIHKPEINEWGSSMCSARYSVNIVGDLRDVKDFSSIESWVKAIKKRCKEKGMWIRQGVVMVKDDGYPKAKTKTWSFIINS